MSLPTTKPFDTSIEVSVSRVLCRPGDRTAYGYGTTRSGLRLTFIGDREPMEVVARAVKAGGPVIAVIQPHQVYAFEEDEE